MYLVEDLYKQHGSALGLELITGEKGLRRRISVPEVQRPGLSLTGYLKKYTNKRIFILGRMEIEYLRELDKPTLIERLKNLLAFSIPAIIVCRRFRPPKELVKLCAEANLPLFRSNLLTMMLLSKLTFILTEQFSPSVHVHGTFVEVFGVGVLIQGASAAGKSEAALGLLERGHRLVSDDLVKIKKREDAYLEGTGVELTQHNMEIRGIGIINVAHLYGAICICESKKVELVVKLEVWDDNHFYDRIGMDEKHCDILGVQVPFHLLPVKPGRDVVLLLETLALNHRLKQMGYHSAREFNTQLLGKLKQKRKRSEP
ncbi:MAG: hprK [Chlamydiales bacterium]|jgi:HPr kinase/phosphorylase|nr:hprK [Chlamydiales bacterium]